MTESPKQPPKRQDLSGPHHGHLGDAARPEVVAEGYVPLGKAAKDQREAGGGSTPNPPAPPKGETPSAYERLKRQAEGR